MIPDDEFRSLFPYVKQERRRCLDCGATLSMYNQDSICSVHKRAPKSLHGENCINERRWQEIVKKPYTLPARTISERTSQ